MEYKVKEIPGYPGYAISENGKIFSYWTRGKNARIGENPRQLKEGEGTNGYIFKTLKTKEGKLYNTGVHRLVAITFLGKAKNKKMTVSHLDGNRKNNNIKNLIWETQAENLKRRIEHGTHDRGCNNSRALLNKIQIKEIKKLLRERKLTHKTIGKKFNVSRLLITKINKGYRYKYDI